MVVSLRRLIRINAIVACAWMLNLTAAAQQIESVGRSLAEAQLIIANACKSDDLLRGAWIKLEPVTDSTFEPVLIVDSRRETQQINALKVLLGKLPVPLVAPKTIHRVGFSDLVSALQARVQERLGKKGTFVVGAFFANSPSQVALPDAGIELTPFGRIESENSKAAIVNECEALMASDPVWDQLGIVVVDRALKVRELSDHSRSNLAALHSQLEKNELLHGSWIRLAECFNQNQELLRYDAYLFVDAGRAAQQRAALHQLLRSVLADKYSVIEETLLPLKDLVAAINVNAEALQAFDGCVVLDAGFAADPADPATAVLKFRGRVHEPKQTSELLDKIVLPLMDRDKIWHSRLVELFPNTTEMSVLPINEKQAAYFFSEGKELFRGNRFEEAASAFMYASIDSPNSTAFRYWRIVSLLKLGRRSEAFGHMLAVLRRGDLPFEAARVERSLERMQGPTRIDLVNLEMEARRELYRFQQVQPPSRRLVNQYYSK